MENELRFWRRHRGLLAGAAAALVVLAGIVILWFQPQKLWMDDKVDEALPVQVAQTGTTDRAVTTTINTLQEPEVLGTGTFRSLEHTTTGRATALALPTGERFLRFEDLDTSNGPDLRVYLSAAAADAPEGAFDDDFVELGKLKGNVGNQNYEIPAGTDLDRYRSAVIWCRRFSTGFAVAPVA